MLKQIFYSHLLVIVTTVVFTPIAVGKPAINLLGTKQLIQGVYTQDLEAAGYFQQGVSSYSEGNLAAAFFAFQKAVERDPSIAMAYHYMGNVLLENGRNAEAIAEFSKAIELDPSLAEAHYNLGIALYRQGRLDDAIAAYQRYIAINPLDRKSVV